MDHAEPKQESIKSNKECRGENKWLVQGGGWGVRCAVQQYAPLCVISLLVIILAKGTVQIDAPLYQTVDTSPTSRTVYCKLRRLQL